MIKLIKTKLPFILGGIFLVAFAIAGCNNEGGEEKAATTDSPKTEIKTETPPPATTDTPVMDQGDTRPVPSPN